MAKSKKSEKKSTKITKKAAKELVKKNDLKKSKENVVDEVAKKYSPVTKEEILQHIKKVREEQEKNIMEKLKKFLPQDMLKQISIKDNRVYFKEKLEDAEPPHLNEVQLQSYENFLKYGIKETFLEFNPIQDFSKRRLELNFLDVTIGKPKFNDIECLEKKITYEATLTVRVSLTNLETGEIKEQDVYFGTVPLMTDRGTFIINGVERVVVMQLVRCPGIFISQGEFPGKYAAKIIPKDRGAWVEIETGKDNVLYCKIDRKRKFPVTAFLRAFGWGKNTEIKEIFADIYSDNRIKINNIQITLEKDYTSSEEEGLVETFKKIRPGDLATPENAKILIENMFFDFKRYDLGEVGRFKINTRYNLNKDMSPQNRIFQLDELIMVIKELCYMNNGYGIPDDIDSLWNRRLRAVGEQVQNHLRKALLKVERIIKDRMTVMDMYTVTPQQLINPQVVSTTLKDFFATSQLSQFMDQINCLSELEHKRRLTSLGPGGLSRDRASYEVRDLHETHYGRICPIQTPEGPNVGLVLHLATHAKVDKYGFLIAPYKVVKSVIKRTDPEFKNLVGRELYDDVVNKKGEVIISQKNKGLNNIITKEMNDLIHKSDVEQVVVKPFVTDEICYLNINEEKNLVIAQSSAATNELGEFVDNFVSCRTAEGPMSVHIKEVTHKDLVATQIVSVASSLIPFLEHDDSKRVKMGSNMQRQAVPLWRSTSPYIGTGLEKRVARDTSYLVISSHNGKVVSVDADHIDIVTDEGEHVSYKLRTFVRTNHDTIQHQRPIVNKGDIVVKGDVLAEGAATSNGEISLGQNLLVAYMPWYGYNFEDAIVISERVYREGLFDSVHIDDYEVDIRDTKLGPEQTTRDIPNISADKLKNLDADGIINIGAEVSENDILVGKITPKGETELTPEEKLLRAIFGDKAHDVKDTSLRMPVGEKGKVISVQILTRKTGSELPVGVLKKIIVSVAKIRKISVGDKMVGRHGNKGIVSIIVPVEDMPFMEDGTPIDIVLNPLGVLARMNIGQLMEVHLGLVAAKLGVNIASPVLEGIKPDQIEKLFKICGFPIDGKFQLYDGKTGDPFYNKTTVGYTYMMKLIHLVDTKIHARSTGPYSLITQQPLGGKALKGGQRLGEMEVWALEAYGAVYTLQEMLTIKSDDVFGRAKAYEAIIKGEEVTHPNIPASFSILVKELQACGLKLEFIKDNKDVELNYEEDFEDLDMDYSDEE